MQTSRADTFYLFPNVLKASLERVQHKFLRVVNYKLGINIDNSNYDYLISHLKLNTLEQRRDYYLSFRFKLISGKIVCPIILSTQAKFQNPKTCLQFHITHPTSVKPTPLTEFKHQQINVRPILIFPSQPQLKKIILKSLATL